MTDFNMLNRLRLDGVEGYLANPLAQSDLTMDLTYAFRHDGGVMVPTFKTDEYLPITILDANYVLKEIVYVTEYSEGQTIGIKITRGQEGTDPFPHSKGNKVVHAATAEDFLAVLKHDQDPDAHRSVMEEIARLAAEAAIAAHEAKADPHPQYMKKSGGSFEGDVTITNLTVTGTLTIPKGARLLVQGRLEIETPEIGDAINGVISIHGKRLIIADAEPPSMANTVWIQTFGG